MSGPVYIFAGGGTGGHLFPGLAVAEELGRLQPAARIVFACSDRPIDRRILSGTDYAMVTQPIRPLPRGWRGWGRFLVGWCRSGQVARDLLADLRPRAVLGLGGFAAAAVVRAAGRRGVRTALLSIDAVPGLANRWLAGKVETIFAQFASTARHYGRWGDKVRVVGCPVRSGLTSADPAAARRALGLRDDRRTLLVVSGSLGAANINGAIAALREDLASVADTWQMLHVTGPGKGAPAGAAEAAALHTVRLEFCERMDLAYAAADLVLSRAGASTIGELIAAGRPAVLMPYPYHRDRQQHLNAEPLVAEGAAVLVEDLGETARNAESLRRALLPILREPGRLEAMRSAAAELGKPGAAAAVARWLVG